MAYRINHIHLKAPDPRKTAEWYARAFGFKIVSDDVRVFGDRFLRCQSEDGGMMVNISAARTGETLGPGDASAHHGLEHFGFDSQDIEADIARLEALGARLLEGPIQLPNGPRIAFLRAPDGGPLADRFGWKIMLIRSLAGFTVIIAAMGLVTSVQQLLIARLLQGLFAGFSPMAIAVASVSAPRDKVSVAIARVQGAQLISVAVGPAVGGLVASHLGIRSAFLVTATLCAVSLLALIVLFQEARPLERGDAPAPARATPLRE